MRHEKPEQSTLLWEKGSGISGKCSAAVCARIYYFRLAAGRSAGSHITETAVEKMTPEERGVGRRKIGIE